MDLATAFMKFLAPLDRWKGEGVIAAIVRTSDWQPWLGEQGELELLLDEEERLRVQRKRRESDRETLRLAYGMRRLLLGRALNLSAHAVPLQREASGRPWLAGFPDWCTSLSHSRNAAAIAFGQVKALGIDIEDADRATDVCEIKAEILHADDAEAAHRNGSDPVSAEALLALWVRKESALKAAGTGLALRMTTFAAPESDPFPLPGNASRWIRTHRLEVPEGLVAAAALPPGVPIRTILPGPC